MNKKDFILRAMKCGRKMKKTCMNCTYHDYDEYCGYNGDYIEFEICRKGHYAPFDGPCKDWEKE